MCLRKLLLGAAALLVGCDEPTRLEESTTTLSLGTVTLPATRLFPSGILGSGGRLWVRIPEVRFARTLGTMCPQCRALHGTVMAKPAFRDSFEFRVPVAADVNNVTFMNSIDNDSRLTFTNYTSFSFPPATGGSISFRILGSMAGPNFTTNELIPGATGGLLDFGMNLGRADGFTVRVVAHSPAGDAILIDTAQYMLFAFRADVNLYEISDAEIDTPTEEVVFDDRFQRHSMPSSELENVTGGELKLELLNSFSSAGTGHIRFCVAAQGICTSTSQQVNKTFNVFHGDSNADISLSPEEVRLILGNASCPSGCALVGEMFVKFDDPTMRLQPQQSITVTAELDVTVLR